MIDLEFPSLPTCIVVDGRELEVETSFRAWLRWGRLLRERGIASTHVLREPPQGDWVPAAAEFYASPNATPREDRSGEEVIDLALDGDYIVGSFQQAYGIDLTSGDMHWHRFLALLRSLPKDTKLVEIAGYRAWTKSKRSQESVMRRLRDDWALPRGTTDAQVVSAGASEFLDANERRLWERLRGGDEVGDDRNGRD